MSLKLFTPPFRVEDDFDGDGDDDFDDDDFDQEDDEDDESDDEDEEEEGETWQVGRVDAALNTSAELTSSPELPRLAANLPAELRWNRSAGARVPRRSTPR
jgi:hypothetical protein